MYDVWVNCNKALSLTLFTFLQVYLMRVIFVFVKNECIWRFNWVTLENHFLRIRNQSMNAALPLVHFKVEPGNNQSLGLLSRLVFKLGFITSDIVFCNSNLWNDLFCVHYIHILNHLQICCLVFTTVTES